ncbi:translocation protein Sec62 [Ceratobasidium sp. AG-Ba]|nr:translocation protein Sec62 [Ceratobasidium sp. AG-Ba]
MENQKSIPKELLEVVNFLRSSSSGIKTRVGALGGKRHDYFKGKAAVKAVLSPAYAKLKNAPKVTSEPEAVQLLHTIIPYTYFLRVDRGDPTGGSKSPKNIQINPMQMFSPDEYYVWLYEGSQLTTYVGGAVMVAIIFAGVLFPLWPSSMRLGVWYLSIGVLGLIGLFFVIAILRLIFYVITVVVASPGIWIFPQLFADVGFVDSFIPLWEWDIPKKKKSKKERAEKKAAKAAKAAANGTPVVIDGPSPAGSIGSTPISSRVPSARIEEIPDDEA